MAKVTTTISSDRSGKIESEVKVDGIPGGACRIASAPALEALGGSVISDELTDEACQLGQAEQNNIDLNQGNQ